MVILNYLQETWHVMDKITHVNRRGCVFTCEVMIPYPHLCF